jgi:hypothetical protein
MAEDRLRLNAWLEPETDIVVGQEVRMTVELATPRWFAGGTRITLPEINHVIVFSRNQFATNFSRREGATTWVVQRWQLELYPQTAGRFRVPPLAVELAVNDAEAGIVRGRVNSPPLEFSASVPAALAATGEWLATPRLIATQRFDRELAGLVPGDAFTRTVEIEATELAAMMLPEPLFPGPEGISAYPDLPELVERSNRGEATAIRRQSVTYLVEREGQYRLPEQRFYWWNTRDQRIETTRLAAVEIDAGVAAIDAGPLRQLSVQFIAGSAALAVAAALAVLLGLWLFRWRQSRPKNLLRQADRALRCGAQEEAVALAYAWLNSRPADTDWLSLRQAAARQGKGELSSAVEALLDMVFSAHGRESASGAEAGAVLRQLDRTASDRGRRADAAEYLTLNPHQPRK